MEQNSPITAHASHAWIHSFMLHNKKSSFSLLSASIHDAIQVYINDHEKHPSHWKQTMSSLYLYLVELNQQKMSMSFDLG